MEAALRKTGVDVLGDMAWGAHLCIFYESQEDLLDTVAPYFKAGLENNEFCLWAPSEKITLEQACLALSRRIPDFDRRRAAGNMEIVPGRDWYLEGDRFGLERVISSWDEKLRGALAKGYDGIRVSGDAFWLNSKYYKDFCDYEHALNWPLEGRPMLALCTYPLVASSAAEVLEVARAHHLALARRQGDWEFVESGSMPARNPSLTRREREVLWWAAQGKSAWEIGKILRVTKRTVDAHAQTATRKLGAANKTQAVAIALRERLIGTVALQAKRSDDGMSCCVSGARST
jgi:DNA-binding CsgD family transcriptional regulator